MLSRQTSTLAHTDSQHHCRKEKVSSGQSELEQLEARLRATEQRLAKVSRQNSPSRPTANLGAVREEGAAATTNTTSRSQAHPFAQRPTYPEDRPPTRPAAERENTQQLMQGMPGAMPLETPSGQGMGREDYVMVEGQRGR